VASDFGLGARGEVFRGDVRAILARKGVSESADFDFSQVAGLGDGRIRLVFEKKGHDGVPDGRSPGVAGFEVGAHRGVVIVADPDGGEAGIGAERIADGPVVTFGFGRAGFDRNGVAGDIEVASGAKSGRSGAIISKDVTDEKGGAGGKDTRVASG